MKVSARNLRFKIIPTIGLPWVFFFFRIGSKDYSLMLEDADLGDVREWAKGNGVYMSKIRRKPIPKYETYNAHGYMRMTADQLFAFKMRWL